MTHPPIAIDASGTWTETDPLGAVEALADPRKLVGHGLAGR